MRRTARIGFVLFFGSTLTLADDKRPEPPAVGPESVQDLIFLGENRPIFLRLRMTLGTQAFRLAWLNSVKAMHAYLDRNNDGIVTREEADRGALATLVRVANGGATAMPRGDLDIHPKDGVVSIDELADTLRTALGPFRVQAGKITTKKTDALFDHLDQNKDGKLSHDELTDAASSLHRLDLDDDDLIDEIELEPFANMTYSFNSLGRIFEVSPVIELFADDSSLRPVRQLLKKYDKGTTKGATSGDNKLSLAEFAIEPSAFARADADADGTLDTEELRRFLAKASPDIDLTITLSADATGSATISLTANGSKPLPSWAKYKQLGPADAEIAADEVRLDLHVDDGAAALVDSKRSYMALFEAADTDNNGYVEKSELTKDTNHPSPLAALFDILDRDGDGKLYPKEMEEFVESQARAARDRMVLTTSDQGRAIFSILDLNRDQRLGIREIRGTLDRVVTWDRDGDARITAEEIPHHYQLTLSRGQLGNVGNTGVFDARNGQGLTVEPVASGPNWFRRMDRNRDGDVSPREFRGPKPQFLRLDNDKDGLIDAREANAITTTTTVEAKPSKGK